jgi:hypothetical protein
MQIRKTYKNINPPVLYDEIKELVSKKGLDLDQDRLETYSMPSDSSSFIYRGTLTFTTGGQESLRVHIVGSDKSETKVLLDTNDKLFSQEQVSALEEELDFMLGSFEPPV